MKKFLSALLGAALWLAALPNAQATILHAGTEDVEYLSCTGTCTTETDGRTFRSTYSRLSYTSTGVVADPPTNRFRTQAFAGQTSLWFHAQFCTGNGNDCGSPQQSTANMQMLRFMDDLGNPTLIVRGTGVAGQLKVSSRTAAGVFTDLVTCSGALNNTANTPTQVDLFIDYGAAGTITLYNNTVQVCTFTGDTRNGDGATTLTQVEFSSSASGAGAIGHWTETIVSTTDTRSMAYLRATPLANGNAVQWTGTNICSSIWPAVTINDASFAQSATNNQLQECTVFNTFPGGTWRVNAVVMSTRAQRGASGPQHIQWLTRTGGADFTSVDETIGLSFANYKNIQHTNPGTALPWTVGDVTAAGFNLGLKSTP